MSARLLIPMPGNETAARVLAQPLDAAVGQLALRSFPDGEIYLRFDSALHGQTAAIVCTLDHPNDKILSLLFAAATARELGAAKIGLVAPYLAYMRQDRRFKPGEAVTSREIARLLSETFDWLVTIDPHLHRYGSLNEIYSIPSKVVHATPFISQWTKANILNALIIGPDSESEQWVSMVAKDAGAPYTVLEKTRRGDRNVEISIKNLADLGGRTPVLVDDIISTGHTMLEAIRLLKTRDGPAPVCLAIHGLFADDAYEAMIGAGARVITCNTVPHPSNAVDVHSAMHDAIRTLMG